MNLSLCIMLYSMSFILNTTLFMMYADIHIIALNAHAIKGNREAVQRSDIDDLDQLLAGSWPLWTLCILLLHQLPMHKVKPFKSGEMW